ncbi:hypothetical protein Fot_03678 [Forsythia ovata]|uniref:Uncharacterized protein n=1 Tax=Forsythia ovata TaxID=205694 RepID=A0ABD1XAE7_9LAMI
MTFTSIAERALEAEQAENWIVQAREHCQPVVLQRPAWQRDSGGNSFRMGPYRESSDESNRMPKIGSTEDWPLFKRGRPPLLFQPGINHPSPLSFLGRLQAIDAINMLGIILYALQIFGKCGTMTLIAIILNKDGINSLNIFGKKSE